MADLTNISNFDRENGAENPLSPPPDFDGPTKSRQITDPLCLLLLLASWGLTSWIGVWSLQNGQYDSFLHPADYKGRICGIDKDSSGNLLPEQWHAVDYLSNGVCVDECPQESKLEPTESGELVCKDEEDLLKIEDCNPDGSLSEDPSVLVACGGCMYRMGTNELRYQCIPDNMDSVIDKVNESFESIGSQGIKDWTAEQSLPYYSALIRDLRSSGEVVLGVGIGGSTFLGTLFLIALQIRPLVACVVWISLILVPLGFGGCGALLWLTANEYSLNTMGIHPASEILCIKIFAIAFWVCAGISFFHVLYLRRQITLVVSITKIAGRALKEVKRSSLFPFLQLLGYALFLGVMLFWLIFLSTTGDFVEQTSSGITFVTQDFTMISTYAFWFILVVFFWTSEFIVAMGQISLSLCFSEWYFTVEKDEGNNISFLSCTCTSLFKHAGTAAFGSMMLSFVRVIRAPILLLQNMIKRSGRENKFIDAIICSCQCPFFLLERFMKYLSARAYIQTALFGYSFCKGSHESYYLVSRHAGLMSEARTVSELSVIFCKLVICITISVVSFVMLDVVYDDEIASPVSVTAIIGLLAWFIGDFFTETIGIAVSTILHCFVADEEMYGDEGSLYVPDELDEFLNKLNEGLGMNQPEMSKGSESFGGTSLQ